MSKAKLWMGRRFLDAESVNCLVQVGISVEGWLNIVYLYNANRASGELDHTVAKQSGGYNNAVLGFLLCTYPVYPASW